MTGRIVQAPPTAGDGELPAVGGTNPRSPLTPLVAPPAEKIPAIKAGQRCSCWGLHLFHPGSGRLRLDPSAPAGQGGILGLGRPPCTPSTCDPACRACQAAERPFLSYEELRFLDHGTGPLAAELAALWAAKDTPKAGRHQRERALVCSRGHPREPGRVGKRGECRQCNTECQRARRARARAAAG